MCIKNKTISKNIHNVAHGDDAFHMYHIETVHLTLDRRAYVYNFVSILHVVLRSFQVDLSKFKISLGLL